MEKLIGIWDRSHLHTNVREDIMQEVAAQLLDVSNTMCDSSNCVWWHTAMCAVLHELAACLLADADMLADVCCLSPYCE